MNNNQEFMKSFNNIEKELRKSIDAFRNVAFYELVEKNAQENKIVEKYAAELKTLADLRNFIVHGDIGDPLAVAADKTVERINHIEKQLINPIKINEVFTNNVIGVREETSLAALLDIIKEKSYSQFPVISEAGFVGLVTENGITNWLAKNAKNGIVSIEDAIIKDVMEEEEEKESYSVLTSEDTLYSVIEMFDTARKAKDKTFVVIVLKDYTKNIQLSDIYTIITPWDMNIIYENLGLKI
nr:CBS domain-containing protein [Tissierella sp.]